MGWVSNRRCGSQFTHNKHLFYHDSFICDGYIEDEDNLTDRINDLGKVRPHQTGGNYGIQSGGD